MHACIRACMHACMRAYMHAYMERACFIKMEVLTMWRMRTCGALKVNRTSFANRGSRQTQFVDAEHAATAADEPPQQDF